MGFVIHWNESAMDYMCSPSRSPLPPPSPPDPSRSSQCTRSERLSHASNLGWWTVQYLLSIPDRYSSSQFTSRATMHIFHPVHLAFQRFEPFFHILIPSFLSFLSISHYCKGPGSAPSNKLISTHLGQPWVLCFFREWKD